MIADLLGKIFGVALLAGWPVVIWFVFVHSRKKKYQNKIPPKIENDDTTSLKARTSAEVYCGRDRGEQFARFVTESEWFQPYFNLRFMQGGFWIDEKKSESFMVHLGTIDQPDYGRTYNLFFDDIFEGTLQVGQIALAYASGGFDPYLGDDDPRNKKAWGYLTISLGGPIHKCSGGSIHDLLSNLMNIVRSDSSGGRDFGGGAIASKLIAEAAWDLLRFPQGWTGLEHSECGTFFQFLSQRELWFERGIDPWQRVQNMRSKIETSNQ